MKIGILTHYDVNNQGAQLQMYALCKQLEYMKHEPIILTYDKNYDFDKKNKLAYQPSIKSIPTYINKYLIKNGIKSMLHNFNKLKKNKKFRTNNFKFENYATANIDMAIVGSDEVFSIPMGVNMMMFGHCVNTDKIISYAPSFGQTDIKLLEQYHCKELVESGLKRFSYLSARDDNTKKIIEKLTNKSVVKVCDPAILYDLTNIRTNIKKIKKRYMVIYSYDYNMNKKSEVDAIRQYAKSKDVITVSVGTYHKWCDKNISCNALEWVDVIKNAECVITDTFHGTIVSAVSNCPMAVFVRDTLNSNKLNSLVKDLNIEERRINEVSLKELERVFESKYDASKVEHAIKELREDSFEYLNNAINQLK